MKNFNVFKIMFIPFLLILLSEQGFALLIKCNNDDNMPKKPGSQLTIDQRLSIQREFIPHSLKGRIRNETAMLKYYKSTDFNCPQDSLCDTFDDIRNSKYIFAWMGFEYEDTTGNYFVTTYGPQAKKVANNTYATKKWDKKVYWINISATENPLPIQPRFVGIDEESGHEWYSVDYFGYQKAGIDYSNYWDNISVSSLILLIDPNTNKVQYYYLEYYNENDEYVEDYELQIGDKVMSYFLAFKEGEEDADYLLSIEEISTISDKVTFDYNKAYLNEDFNCSHCGDFDLSQIEFKYTFEALTKNRSHYTKPKPIDNSSNNLNTSSTKSIPISSFWLFFLLSILITMISFKNKLRVN